MSSPTLLEFQLASNTMLVTPSWAPLGMTAFKSNGQPMAIEDASTGLYGRVWETGSHKLMITFMATNPLYGITHPQFLASQIASDISIFTGHIAPVETEALAFAQSVQKAAAAAGIAQSDIYTTGISLGGTLAEYVAQQTGMGGIGFVSTGIPTVPGKAGATNFINIVATGDPWSMHDARLGAEPGISTAAAGGGTLTHYGKTWVYGDSFQNTLLTKVTSAFVARENSGADKTADFAHAFLDPLNNPLAIFKYGLPGIELNGLFAFDHVAAWQVVGVTNGFSTIEQLNATHTFL